jgi:hypothetical protein
VEFAVAALDEGNVAMTERRYVGDGRALALEHGIGGDGGAEPDIVQPGPILEVGKTVQNARHRITRRRRLLPHLDRFALGVVAHEIGESAADVYAQHEPHGCLQARQLTLAPHIPCRTPCRL